MKKVFLSPVLFLLLAAALSAQEAEKGRKLFLTAGTNNSRFSEENSEGAECLLRLFFGAEYLFCPNRPLSFSTGMQFQGSGSKYKSGENTGEGGSYSFENQEVLNYLAFPLEARYEFEAGKIRPFVRGGGMFGILLSAKSKTKTTFNGQENTDETDIKNQKKSTNIGLTLGGGILFPVGKLRGTASVRYGLGLTNVVKSENAPGAKTRDLTYAVGLGLPL